MFNCDYEDGAVPVRVLLARLREDTKYPASVLLYIKKAAGCKRAMPLPVSRVMVVCNHCDRPTRIAHRTLDNGSRVRVCKHCGEPLEVKS